MLSINQIDTRVDNAEAAIAALREKLSPRGDIVSEAGKQRTIEVFGEPLSAEQVVQKICGDVREQGLSALLEYTAKLDRADLSADTIQVTADEINAAHELADESFLQSVRQIRDNILQFQQAILHTDVDASRVGGATLKQRYVPLHRIGICVPGGAAAYPSTVLMTAVPAKAAGVSEIVVVAPPTEFGAKNADVLAVCKEVGVTEVYRVGGAQAIAALAYGVEGVAKVDKIVGPGNMFVALAKKLVYGEVDIDSIAGPSEVVVIADETTRPDFTAADILAQAEHAPGASILISWCDELIENTLAELTRQVQLLSRSQVTIDSLNAYGAILRVADADEACRITDDLAPEHLHIATRDPESMLAKIRNAGAAFLGNFSPVALGDYAAGPSHVLPTSGTARWASGLTANDFLRGHSVISFSEEALRSTAANIGQLAEKEGLTAHKASVDIRLKK